MFGKRKFHGAFSGKRLLFGGNPMQREMTKGKPMPTGFKVLNERGEAYHGGSGQWHLPVGKKPGKWMPVVKDIELCARGYHICRHETDLLQWLGPTIWRVEYRGEVKVGGDKLVAEQARLVSKVHEWNDKIARLFAVDCAERVLKLIPESHRSPFTNSVKVARDFANGRATGEELASAASAAWAAWAAERKWQGAQLKKYLGGNLP
jgi:hypothetical protein